MFRFLQSKKGFTLVELMIVLIMLGFGAFALINLSQSAWRSFHKSEERYAKQEAVKYVAEVLQKGAKITAATSADIFDDVGVVPNGDIVDKSYSYLYVQLEDKDGDGTNDGYYLYILDAGKTRENAKLLADVPMYISIDAYQDVKFDGSSDYENKSGAVVRVMALENDYDFASGKAPYSDEVFYELDISYHFPNMATSKTKKAVNFPNGDAGFKLDSDNHVVPNENRDDGRAVASAYTNTGALSGSVSSVDKSGVVLRVYIDSILSGDNSEAGATVPSFCFIATASYGHDSGEVGLLCDFRDSVLMQSAPGRAFVKAYYTVSPPIAKVIAGSEPLKAAVRLALKPLVIVATFALDHDLLAANMAYIIILMISAAAAVTVIVYCRRKRRKE